MYGTRPAGGTTTAAIPYLEDGPQKRSMMAALGRQTLNTVEVLAKVLDYPGAIARGVLAGDNASGFSWDSDRRVTGRELLEQYGMLSPDSNPYWGTAAGLAAEIATDPLAVFSTAPLKVAGKAAQAAGILDKASDAATLAMGGGDFLTGARAARDQLRTGRAAYKWLGDLMPAGKALNRANAAYRPLVGPRTARSMVTLDDLVKSLPDKPAQDQALEALNNYLGKRGKTYADVKDDTLGGAFGMGYFNLVDPAVANPRWARGMLDTMDRAGQAVRWSLPVRYGSQLFSQKVKGDLSAVDQLMNMRGFAQEQAEIGAQRMAAARHAALVSRVQIPKAAQDILGTDTLSSPQGRDFLTRLYEGTHTAKDMRAVREIGQSIKDVVQNWDSIRSSIYDEAGKLGMYRAKLEDRFGGLWSPRVAREAAFGEYGQGLSRAANTARMLENESRQAYLMLPGVTVDLREIQALPKVQKFISEGEKSTLSVDEVATSIKQYIDNKWGPAGTTQRVRPFTAKVYAVDDAGKVIKQPELDAAGKPILDAKGKPKMVPKIAEGEVISHRQAQRIARFAMRKKTNAPLDAVIFGEHPTVSQARAMVSQGIGRAHARHVYDSMAEAAISVSKGGANAYPGVGFKPLGQALDEIAKTVGLTMKRGTDRASARVRNILRERIARAYGIADPSTVRLNDYALPESVYNRLTRLNDFYNSPRAQENIVWLFDSISTLFKGFALAFPATKVRDMYSNAFLLALEAGNPTDVLWGLKAAKAMVGGRTDEFLGMFKEVPGYNLADATAIHDKVIGDVSRTGLLETLATSDLASSNQTGILNHLVPGAKPLSKMDAIRELIPDGSRSLRQMIGDQFTFRDIQLPFQKQAGYETRNAMLNASQKFSDYTDSVARLGGMFALMRQGISPDVAAQRITSALVDYGSLTLIERQYARRIFPWWAYQSRIGKYVVQQLAENPGGGYAQTLRGLSTLQASDENTYIPEGMRQQFAFRVPKELEPYLGIEPNASTTTFFNDFDVPGTDTVAIPQVAEGPFASVQGTAYNLAQQVNPFIKSAMEIATNVDTFSRRPLRQAVTPADRVYKSLYQRVTGTPAPTGLDPLIKQAINVTPGPWQRFISIAGGLADDRIPLQQRLLKQTFNSIAGVKMRTIDPAWQISDMMRKLEGPLEPFLQDYTLRFVPQRNIPQLPPDLIPQYQAFKTLGRDLQQARR